MSEKLEMEVENQSKYEVTLNRLLTLADFERNNLGRRKKSFIGLSRMIELVQRLDNPQNCAPVVHVAGTKGKGSVASMVSSILQKEGLKVGLFTSPHLLTFRERIRINGTPLNEETFVEALESIWPEVIGMGIPGSDECPSTFECLTAMAFHAFKKEKVDVQVIEVGLGGRLDSTNVAEGNVSVITSLSLDHVNVLGGTIEAIAQEKSGIIKQNSIVVSAPQVKEAYGVIEETCLRQNAQLISLGKDIYWESEHSDLKGQSFNVKFENKKFRVELPLLGAHQQENATAAIAAVLSLVPTISSKSIEFGLAEANWEGRFQVISEKPYVVLDGAHNEYSMECLYQAIVNYFPGKKTKLVFGCSTDKDLLAMAKAIAPATSEVISCSSRHPKSANQQIICDIFNSLGIPSKLSGSVQEALKQVLAEASSDELIVVTGSLFVVGESIEFWRNISPELYPLLRTGRH